MSRPDESRRGTVRDFINYLKKYEERKATNREPLAQTWLSSPVA